MNPKLEGMEKSVYLGYDTEPQETQPLHIASLKSKLEELLPYSDANSAAQKELMPACQPSRSVSLEDGTVVGVPYNTDMVKSLEETFADFGYHDKEMSASLTRSEIDSGRDLFAEFGFDMDEFRTDIPAEAQIINSNDLDFWEAYEEYTNEDLYTHWNCGEQCEGTRRAGPNCMAYAYGIPKEMNGSSFSQKPSPGHFAGIDTSQELSDVMEYGPSKAVKDTFEKYMKMDFDALGKELVEVGSSAYQPKAGERMFALVTSSDILGYGPDFHFYVKDKNGFWSHKPGTTNPTIFDNAGDTIKDPSKCNRGVYTNFVGFYVIKNK